MLSGVLITKLHWWKADVLICESNPNSPSLVYFIIFRYSCCACTANSSLDGKKYVKVIKHKPPNKHKHTNICWHTYSTKHRIVILWLSAFLFIFHFVFFDNHIQKWKTSTNTHVVIIISNVSCFRAACNKKSRRTRYSKIAKND